MNYELKIAEILEILKDRIDNIEEITEQNNKIINSIHTWIMSATESITTLQKNIEYLNNKKTPI